MSDICNGDDTPHRDRKRSTWRRRRRARPHAGDGASRCAQDLRAHSRRLARRLVLAARRRYPGGKGHKVYAPSLTGNGDRSHLLSKDVILDTHITDIVNLFKWEDLKDVCLVAHSYGGWPSSGALEQIGDRVSSIVWLDAFKPENGQKGTDFASDFSRKAMEEAIAKGDAGPQRAAAVGVRRQREGSGVGEVEADRSAERRRHQPIKLTGAREKIAKKTYIRAPKYPQAAFDKALAECKADASWKTFVNDNTGHDVMVDQPQWLADIILQVS